MNELLKKGVAEMIGTFALTFIGGAAIINGQAGLIGVALAHGLTVAIMVSAIGHISGGHINPAVTIGFLVTGKMDVKESGVYVTSQLVGAVLAAHGLAHLIPGAIDAGLGGQSIAADVTVGFAVLIEMILTFVLVFTIFATAVDEKGAFKAVAGFAIGMVVTIDILAGGPVTGASMNPARSFGPALVSENWINHHVYWIGPIIGGAIAAKLYDTLFLKS